MTTRSERPLKLTDLFTRDEIDAFTRRSNARGALMLFTTWAIILATFVALAYAPHPLTIFVAVFVLAGRQLGLAILMHEASHRTLFANRWANDVLVDWLCAKPIWIDLARYRRHHMAHHARTGTDRDPDISLVRGFPTTRRSMMRKFLRDLSGYTGVRNLIAFALMDAELLRWTVAADTEWLPREGRSAMSHVAAFVRNAWGVFLTNGLLFAGLYALGHGWIFGVWVLAYVTGFPLFTRIRSIVEHAGCERTRDPLTNTRTVRAGPLLRLFVAPNRVNYHLEHHLLVSAPAYRLPEIHASLRARDLIPPAPGYAETIRSLASSR